MQTFFAILHIWTYLTIGTGIAIGCGVLAVFLWPSRMSLLAAGCGIAIAAGTFGYGWGAWDEKQVCLARERAAEAAAIQRDIDQAEKAKADADSRVAEIDAARQQDMEKLREYELELAKRKAPACRLELRDLR